ncbi:hypothetical protein [Bradyrhizobium japonicum]|uniref:hypothetical protein n=1 Tax=Bradyrhizobium japonicum TaxID=375 RepID=UPI001BAACDC0|nr:hypothetical protein [Bradyrhizobium japonicum]MBR0758998.1 hypothetical protein [Bradyrhizobium japonicum]
MTAKSITELTVMRIIAETLKQRIVDIARWTPFTEVHVVFESSSRTHRLIEEAFGDFHIEENGKAIPLECYFVPKAANDLGLVVADSLCTRSAGKHAVAWTATRGWHPTSRPCFTARTGSE